MLNLYTSMYIFETRILQYNYIYLVYIAFILRIYNLSLSIWHCIHTYIVYLHAITYICKTRLIILKLLLEMLWKFVSRQFQMWTLRLRRKIWGFAMKKLKLGKDPYVDGPLRKILKHQTEVDNNPWWLVPVSFLYGNLFWNK